MSPEGTLAADAVLVGSIAAFHVVDIKVIPPRWQLLTHTAVGLAAAGAASRLGVSAAGLGLEPRRAGDGVRAGLATAGLVAAALGVAAALPSAEAWFADERVSESSPSELARWAALDIPVGTAVYEELVFRSALLGLALRRLPTPAAVAVTSTLFGLWHVLPALDDPRQNLAATVVATGVAGAAFAALRLRSGSVVAPILAHTATNAGALVAAALVLGRRRRRAGA